MFGYYGPGYHKDVIKAIAKYTNCQTYLELGVFDGLTMSEIYPLVKRCIGVDIYDMRVHKVGEFYQMSTDDFFKTFKDGVDIIFIDADHKYESVVTDFENSLKILNKYGIIFLHDTDPMAKEYIQPGFCNDCYKIVDYIQENHPELNITTLPLTEAGLSIVSRKSDRRINEFI